MGPKASISCCSTTSCPDGDGLAVLKKIKEADPDTLVILLTAYSTVDTAVEAMKHGAYHYANKPFNLDEIALLVAKALETTRLRREVRALRASQARPSASIGSSASRSRCSASRRWSERSRRAPASTVLLTGESGTGKDLAAKVHALRERARGAAVHEHHLLGAARRRCSRASCSATSAARSPTRGQQKRGLLEQADGGTVFLDEIGEMAPALQAKLLRFLEEKTFKRVGGVADIRVDVRVIAATNRNLEDEVKKGRFREDLYYRLNVLPIELPPLRARADDIPALVHFFVDAFNVEFKKRVRGVTDEAMRRLQTYGWPGQYPRAAERRGTRDAACWLRTRRS